MRSGESSSGPHPLATLRARSPNYHQARLQSATLPILRNHRSEDPLLDWAAAPPSHTPSAPLFHEGQILASRFRIVRFLGRGGMGEVYEAVDTTLHHRPVAIKTISGEIRHNPHASRRFLREVELAQRVTHPNICRIHDVYQHACTDAATGDEHLTQFLTMQLLIGETLSEYVVERGSLPEDEALHLLRQLADALAAAHAAGVIHRDFKPGNVILTSDPAGLRPVITDFGVAVLTDRSIDADSDQLLSDYTRAGTPEYASPEQIDGGRVTAATDIYALGVVALEMLTGQTLDRSLTSLSPVQRAALARCLSSDPATRFDSPGAFVRALAEEPLQPAGSSPVLSPKPSPILSRRNLFGAFLGTGATLTAVLIGRKLFLANRRISSLSILGFSGENGVSPMPGFREEMVRFFLQFKKVRVIAPDSAESLTPPFDYAKVAKLLPSDAFLTGIISPADVLVTLVRRDGSVIWQQRFDRSRSAYTLHHEVQSAVLQAIDPEEAESLSEASHMPSQEGYLAYISARSYLTRHTDPDLLAAKGLFNEAIRHDASFAPAWAGLAYTLFATRHMGEARVAADHAIALDKQCAEAYLVKGIVAQRGDWNWVEAEKALNRALELEPNSARGHQWLGGLLSDLGQTGRALKELNIAVELDPMSFNVRIALGICLLNARQFDLAIDRLSEAIAMSRSANVETARPHPYLGTCWLLKGHKKKALSCYQRALDLEPSDFATNAFFVFGAAQCGRFLQARAVLEKLLRSPGAAQNSYYLAVAFLGLGDRDRAFAYLDDAVATRDSDAVLVRSSIYLAPLRTDPRYPAILRKMHMV